MVGLKVGSSKVTSIASLFLCNLNTFFEQHLHNSVVGHTHTGSRQTGGIKLMGQERNNCSSRRRHCACRSWPTKNSKAATRKILCLFSISPKNYIWIWTRSSKLALCAPLFSQSIIQSQNAEHFHNNNG